MNHHPIVNIIMGVRSLHTLRASIDTMGQEKTMDFIAALILEHIKEIGEDRVFVVCMDGAWQWADIDNLIADKKFWASIKVCVKVLLPAVKVLRYSDGMRGGTLGLMYNLLLQQDELYSSPIEGLPDKVRTKVSP